MRVLSSGDALLGVTYCVDPTASPPPSPSSALQIPPGDQAASLVLADPSHLAPGGLFGKWVPTMADVLPLQASAPPPPLREMRKRGRAFFKDQADLAARFLGNGEGRTRIVDFDLIDVCLNPRHAPFLPSWGGAEESSEDGALADALRRLHGPSLGHAGPFLEPVLIDGEGGLDADAGAGDGAATATLREGGWVYAAGSSTAFGGARRRPAFGPSLWRLGRVRLLAGGMKAARAIARNAGTVDVADAGLPLSAPVGGAVSAAVHAQHAFVFWFEPVLCAISAAPTGSEPAAASGGSGGSGATVLRPVLRFAPLRRMLSVAPAGTFTSPFVPGQRIETRRPCGLWAPCDVVSADRFAVCVRVKRPPRQLDNNAIKPGKVAAFRSNASPMIVAAVPATPALGVLPAADGGAAGAARGRDAAAKRGDPRRRASSVSAVKGLSSNSSPGMGSNASPPSAPPALQLDSAVAAAADAAVAAAVPTAAAAQSRRARVAAALAGAGAVPSSSSAAATSDSLGSSADQAQPLTAVPAVAAAVATPVPLEPTSPTRAAAASPAAESWEATGPQPEAHLEAIPRHAWGFSVARAGHYCSETVELVSALRDAASLVQDAFPSSKDRGRAGATRRFGIGIGGLAPSSQNNRSSRTLGAVAEAAATDAERRAAAKRANSVLLSGLLL